MKSSHFLSRIRYNFENVLSKGTVAIIGLLGVVTVTVILAAATIICLTKVDQAPGEEMSLPEAAWQSFLHTIDSGTVAGDAGWGLRVVMLAVTMAGIFIVSILIGTITSGLESKLTELRKGRSRVLENGHTLILGWSSKIHSIIAELIIANENQKNSKIVILAPNDKVEMEDDIKARFPDTKNTRIICRTGSPLDITDLEVVSPGDARSIIVLSPEGDFSDTSVIKSILALTNNPQRGERAFHIVAEIRDQENIEAAEIAGSHEATLVLSSDLIAKVTAQTCRQSGLSIVYSELLDFDGAEVYFTNQPSLAGKSYREVLFEFKDSTVIGIRKSTGEVLLNPTMSLVVESDDSIIVITADDDTAVPASPPPSRNEGIVAAGGRAAATKERTLILGWNERASAIVRELDHYVAPGSEITVVSEAKFAVPDTSELQGILKNQSLVHREGNITDRRTLESIGVENFDHIILLCYPNMDVQQSDAKTLIALLHLRKIAERMSRDFSIVSEMLDMKNRQLAEVAKADDFIVSDKLVSLMLSQLSENKELKQVFDQLFAAEGSEIYLKPIEEYYSLGQETDFYTLVESAARRGETAVGYRKSALARDPRSTYGVVVNPSKSDQVSFEKGDAIIVLAES